ncbi:hypothetical protein KL86DYS1_10563 [uncultured Dysgonomonas sp.]|uniref:Uncharacterized protein n=1 Tax=uncultured Dysgonomonas sp. TaxID=206096 RepID=A0A212IYH6_9BACT|nr:hypothetical protein KL86DYS1_10563 [uncultured Dysgonomonas sp.]
MPATVSSIQLTVNSHRLTMFLKKVFEQDQIPLIESYRASVNCYQFFVNC